MRACWVEVNTRCLEDNYRFLRDLAGPEIECLAIVKADAYGHGLALCASAAVRAGAAWLGVTSVEEGVAARAACPGARILIMGGHFPGQGTAVLQHNLTSVVWTAEQFEELERAAEGRPPGSVGVHLEIDTGMSRQGAGLSELPALLARFSVSSPLRLEAAMTHLYASDEAGSPATVSQLAQLERALEIMGTAAIRPPEFLSVGASAALLGGEKDSISSLAARFGLRAMLRLGLALYGVAPRFHPAFHPGAEPAGLGLALRRLKPVLAWKTRITSLRNIAAGTEVGYNGTFVASEPMTLALLPLGYADGLDRRLGNRFSLLVRGERAPLVGRVSMDQATIDVTEIPGVEAGEEVVILGSQGTTEISAFDHAVASETIPWEVFTRITARVPRVEL